MSWMTERPGATSSSSGGAPPSRAVGVLTSQPGQRAAVDKAKEAAKHEREGRGYQAKRLVRLGWRNRWWTVPVLVVGVLWLAVPAASRVADGTGWWRIAIAATVVGVGWGLFARCYEAGWQRRRTRRLELAFRHRWEDGCRDLGFLSPHGRVLSRGGLPPQVCVQKKGVRPALREPAVKLVDGTVDATVHLPLRLQPSLLVNSDAQLHDVLAGNLFLPGKLGIPEFTQVWQREVNGVRWWGVRCEYRRAPGVGELNHWGFRPAPDDFSLRLGAGPQGENNVDLLASPHIRVYGPPRSGKGVGGADAAAQGCSRGWLILIINCSGAPEWNDWGNADLPNVEVVRCSLRDSIPGAVAITSAMHDLLVVAEVRDALCTAHGAHAWAQLEPEVRVAHPRVLVIIDEPSALLKNAGPAGKTAGGLIEMVARTGPKYGITLMTLDQIINVTSSAISGPTLEVMRYVVWMGDQPDAATRNRVGGFVGWPPSPPGKGGAVAFNFGAPASSKQVRMPYHSPADLRSFLADQKALWTP